MASNKKDLKAYVRYDGTGRIVSSSVILQRFKPKDGNWQEIQAYECCDPSCPIPVYENDWIVFDIQEVYGGVIYNIEINPFEYNIELQFQLISCETGEGIGEIITVNASTEYAYNWFVPTAINDAACAIQSRRICGFNYQSAWVTLIGG
jgi:hypothetical protein